MTKLDIRLSKLEATVGRQSPGARRRQAAETARLIHLIYGPPDEPFDEEAGIEAMLNISQTIARVYGDAKA